MTRTARGDAFADIGERLASPEPEARRQAARALASLDADPGTSLLATALGDADWRVRKEAVSSAQSMKPRAKVVAALAVLLDKREDIGLRNAAVLALRALGSDSVAAVASAFATLDADGRKLAVEVLVGTNDLRAVALLSNALADADVNVRIAAAEALASVTENAAIARERLTLLLGEEIPTELKLATLRSLDALTTSLPLSVIEQSLEDPLLRSTAVRLLRHVKEKRATLLATMALADPHRTTVREALRVLGHRIANAQRDELEIVERALAPAASVLVLLRKMLAEEPDATVRSGAILALSLARAPEDAPLFIDALGDDQIAEAAEKSLRFYGQTDGGALLSATKTAAPSARGAAISLMPLVSRDGDAVLLLRDALDAAEADVVVAALRGLCQLGHATDLERVARLCSARSKGISVAASHTLAALAELYPEAAHDAWSRVSASPVDADADLAGCVLGACAPGAEEDAERRVAYLVRGAGHPEPHVRVAALSGLGMFAGNADARAAVTFAVADEEPSAALAAVRSLAALGEVATLAQVISRSKDASLLGAAFDSLRHVSEGQAEIAIHLLRERLVKEHDETMRAAISFTLARAETDA